MASPTSRWHFSLRSGGVLAAPCVRLVPSERSIPALPINYRANGRSLTIRLFGARLCRWKRKGHSTGRMGEEVDILALAARNPAACLPREGTLEALRWSDLDLPGNCTFELCAGKIHVRCSKDASVAIVRWCLELGDNLPSGALAGLARDHDGFVYDLAAPKSLPE
jgi:hypothetical protein